MNLPEYSEHEIVVQPLSEISDGEITGVVSVVKAVGVQITDVALTDYVLYGACQPDKLSPVVHEMDYIPLPLKLKIPIAGLIYHGAVLLNAFYEAQLEFGENIIVLGNGYRRQLFQHISRIFGINSFSELELNNSNSQNIDALFIISKSTSSPAIQQALELIRPRGRVISLTRWSLEKYWDIFFQKDLQLKFAFSTGATLKHVNEKLFRIPEEYVPGTAKRNLTTFRDWVNAGKITLANIESADLNTKNFE